MVIEKINTLAFGNILPFKDYYPKVEYSEVNFFQNTDPMLELNLHQNYFACELNCVISRFYSTAMYIDCRQVAIVDSEALELLTEWSERLREGGGSLKLASLNDVCSDILMVTRLIHVLNVVEDVKQAVTGS